LSSIWESVIREKASANQPAAPVAISAWAREKEAPRTRKIDQGTACSISFQERTPEILSQSRRAAINAGMAGCKPCQKSVSQRIDVRRKTAITRIS